MKIIGLSGFARVGKDEVANVLVSDHGYQRVAFADKLRDFVYALNPIIVGVHPNKTYWKVIEEGGEANPEWLPYRRHYSHVQDVIDEYGWGGYKETPWGPEIRRLLQRVGTEAGRQTLWDSIWIDAALTGLDEDAKVVVTDARFYNEFDAIRSRGGEIWRVHRPGVGPLNDHPSETEATNYPHFDKHIYNKGSLGDLRNAINEILELSDWGYAPGGNIKRKL